MDHNDRTPAPDDVVGINSDVLNDQAELGRIGELRSSGGADAAAFIRAGMVVIDTDGKLVGTVERVEAGRIRLAGAPGDDEPAYVPLSLVDGVDDQRVVLARRGDASFGVGAEP